MNHQYLIDQLSETVGEQKAEDLVAQAMDEANVRRSDLDPETAVTVLQTITELDGVSSLAAVAANTTLTQLRNSA